MNTPMPTTQGRPRIELLGVPRLVLAEGKPHVLERRDAALLAWLALHGPTPRNRIVGLLWPDLSTRTAQTNLRQRLFRLKQRTGREIVVSDPMLALAAGVPHDLESKQPALDQPAAHDAQTLLGALDYDDCGELGDWVATARERWAADCRDQLARHAAQLETEGRIAEALAFAQRLTVEAPTAEHAHRRVMRLHYRRGDRAAALAAFARCREALAGELGTQPGAETRDLAALIERSGALPPPVAAPSPVTTLRPPRLIGREAEWRAIEAAWQRRQPVLLLGEPGIGKSRLAADFVSAQGQPNVYRAHAGDAQVPYSLLARLLRGLIERFGSALPAWIAAEFSRLLPELGAQTTGKLEPLRLRQAVVEAVTGWQAHGLAALVIDDLHFADDASMEWLLAWLAHGQHPQLVATVRANEMPPLLKQWLRRDGLSGVCEVALEPLGIGAIEALLDSLGIPELDSAAWAGPLARHTGGNPLFILETLKAQLANPQHVQLASGEALAAPAHIGRMLEQRLEQLQPDALRLARLAALAGTDFSVDLAARVLGCHVLDLAEPWGELERAQVISEGAFAHDLILDAALRSVPQPIAVALHRSVAKALDGAMHAPSRIAHHWQKAGDWASAAPHFERAALQAEASARPVEALAAWNAAADCHRAAALPDHQAAAFDCDWHAVRRLCALGSLTLALARAESMLAAATTDRQCGLSLEARAHVQLERNAPDAALADAQRAESLAQQIGDTRLQLLARHQLASALMQLGRAPEAVALRLNQAHALALLGDEEQLDWLGSLASTLDHADRRVEAQQAFDEAITRAVHLRRWDSASTLVNDKGVALIYLGRLQDSTDAARAAIEYGRRAGLEPGSLLMNEMNLAGNLRDLGLFADFLRIAEPLPAALRDVGYTMWAVNAENDLAGGYLWLGRIDLARKVLSPLTDDVPAEFRAARLFTLARVLRDRTDVPPGDEPARLVREAHALLQSTGSIMRSYVRLRVALELARAEPPDEAARRMAAIEAAALEREQFMLAMHALVLRTEALLNGGQVRRAAQAAQQLKARCDTEGMAPGLYAPNAWWIAYRALVEVDAPAVADCLQKALAWIEHAAAHHVPPLFKQSFLTRNPVNAAVRAAAARRR